MSSVQIKFNLFMFGLGVIAIWLIPPGFYELAFSIWFGIDIISNSIFEYYFPGSQPQDNSDEYSKFQLFLRSWLLPAVLIGGVIAIFYFFPPPLIMTKILLTLLLLVLIYKLISNLRNLGNSSPRHA